MTTKKQKREEGARRAHEREQREKERQAMLLREAQEKRDKRRRQRLIAEHAVQNTKVIHTIAKRKEGPVENEEHEDLAHDITADSDADAHIQLGSMTVQRCSACGSDAPHHVKYVLEHGVCVS